jgi:hypothetical protein
MKVNPRHDLDEIGAITFIIERQQVGCFDEVFSIAVDSYCDSGYAANLRAP